MATAAQAPAAPIAKDPVERWLARRSACPQHDANQLDAKMTGSPVRSLRANSSEARRAATNRANSARSTGPRTESGKQRSSQNALSHGLTGPPAPDGVFRGTEIQERSKGVPATAQTAVLPTEDPEAYQRHIQQFLDEYKPATPTETQLVHEIANTAWRLNRIPFLEAELLSHQSLIPQLATLGLHGSRLSRQFQKALDQLLYIQDERRRLERRQLTEAVEIFLRHHRKGLSWEPSDDGFVFSKDQVERHARQLMRLPGFYAAHPSFQAAPPPTGATL